jgi:hypothetical protein
VTNSDSDNLDYLDIDEDAPGDATYAQSGDTNEPSVDWVEAYFPSASIPAGSTIFNITYYYGYYTNDGWGLTTDATTNITWRVDATEHSLTNYTLSSPPDTDLDVTFKQTSSLPSLTNLNSGNFKVRFRGIEDGGGADRFYLDYCYFTINYTMPNIVINEIMYDPSGSDDNAEWVEIYNGGNSAIDLTGWNLTDNDGNRFVLSASGSIPAGGYLVTHLAQTGTNSSTDIYGPILQEDIIQPNAAEGKDNYLDEGSMSTNYGTDTSLQVVSAVKDKNALIQFNLSSIPHDDILNADVWLYQYSLNPVTDVDVDIHRVTNAWTEASSNWNTYDGTNAWPVNDKGGDYDVTAEDTATMLANVNGWYSWSITNLAKSWRDGTYANYGLILLSAGAQQDYYSSDYTTDTTIVPKLVIKYWNHTKTSLLDNNDADDDDAATAGHWTGGDFIDTTPISEGETLGRDKNSADTDTPDDWENSTTNQADPFGVNATAATQGSRNIDFVIPEFGDYIFVAVNISVIVIIMIGKRQKNKGKRQK